MLPITGSANGFCQGLRGAIEDFVDAHRLNALLEGRSVYAIPIPDQVARRHLPGKRLGDLLSGPLCSRMLRHVELHEER